LASVAAWFPVSIVGAKRLEAADDVDEVCAEPRERPQAPLAARAGREADQHHEDGDERDGDEQDDSGGEVARQHPGDEEQRHDDREDGLGEVAGEVGLERVDALHCGGDQLAGATVAQARRARPQDVLAEAST